MASMDEGINHVLAFVEASIVHDNDTLRWKFGNEVLGEPGKEDIRVNVAVKYRDGKEGIAGHCPNDIDSPSSMPIFGAIAPGASGTVAVCSRHIEGKATLV